jgi:formylglycine-generating enzyme required for sulfatase activity
LIAWVTILAAAQIDAETTTAARRALLIGNSAYRHLPPVPAAAVNVELIAGALSQTGFQPVVEYDVSQEKLLETTNRFTSAIQPGDFVFVYFSGYGYGLQEEEVNYLLPVTFDPKDDRAPSLKALSLRRLLSDLEKRGARTKMVILDASRPCPGLPEGLTQTVPIVRTLISFSAAPNQAVADPPGRVPNPFTAALARAIQEPGSTPAGVLNSVQAKISELSKGAQLPYLMPSPVDSFYFVPPKPVVVAEERKPGQSRENPKDLLLYAWIPAGIFKMGCVPGDNICQADEKPQHDVRISRSFWITRTEVTSGAYQRFTEATGHRPPQKTKTNPKKLFSELPVTDVSWDDARNYCTWAGGRLPTEAEWEYAARGAQESKRYPWGDKFDPKLANSWDTDRKQYRNQELVPVRFLGTANGFNLFDAVGNAAEWVNDFYDAAYYASPAAAVDPAGPKAGLERVFRGGAFNGKDKHLRISARDHKSAAKTDNTTGFRCVLPTMP